MGESQRSEEAGNVNRRLMDQNRRIGANDPNVANRFEGYQDQFGYGAMSQRLKELYKNRMGDMNRGINTDVSRGLSGTTASLASRGITGGSALDEAHERVRGGGRTARATGAARLGAANIEGNLGAMKESNRNKFRSTSAAQGVDMENMMNIFRQFGLQGGNLGQQMGNLQNMDDTTIWDDIMGMAAAVGEIVPG